MVYAADLGSASLRNRGSRPLGQEKEDRILKRKEHVAKQKKLENEEIQKKLEMQENSEARKKERWIEHDLCRHCGGIFKGLFNRYCSVCGKPKDY